MPDPLSGRPIIVAPIPGFITLGHRPTPQRREFLSFSLVITFWGLEEELMNHMQGSVHITDPAGATLYSASFVTGPGNKSGLYLPNEEGLGAAMGVIELRNFGFTLPGIYRFSVRSGTEEKTAELRALIAREEN